jgi:hypothetical protein
MVGSTTSKRSDYEPAKELSREIAHSQGFAKKAPPRQATNLKRLTLDLPEELHRAIKLNAVHEGVTMAEKLRALLSEHYGLNEPQQKPE